MNEDRDREEEYWISSWEQQCVEHLEREPDYEGLLQREKDLVAQKLWLSFQNSAISIAQLYKDRIQGVSLWQPFQTAAGTVTSLYKDSSDGMRKSGDLGVQCGYQRRTKELLSWARKKRRHIRREELLSYLAGRSRPSSTVVRRASPKRQDHQMDTHNADEHLHTFREAISKKNHRFGASGGPDLGSFISNEIARHLKRPASSDSSPPHNDVTMDSPTHKKARFL